MSRAPAAEPPQHRTILVYVGLDLIGDGLIKLPFLRALRRAWPGARITWLAGIGPTVFSGALRELGAPYIDEVVENAGVGHGWREVLGRPLGGRGFDLVIDTQRRVMTTLILRRIPHRAFISGSAGFLFSDARPQGPRPRRLSDYLLLLVALASGRAAVPGPPAPVPERHARAAALALPGGPHVGPHVGLAPGAGGRHKCWPLDRFIAVGNAVAGRGAVPVFLLGPQEAEWAAAVRAGCPAALLPLQDGDPEMLRSPLFTVACAARLAAAVANDAGAGHLLAAADVPLLSLFGPTPPGKFAPAVSRGAVLTAQAFGGPEMARIPVSAVLDALDGLLEHVRFKPDRLNGTSAG